jgi:carboxypeptidase family protein/S-layer family protein
MPRRIAAPSASLCLFLIVAAADAEAPKLVPISVKAKRMAVSQPVRELPRARPDPNDERPFFWVRGNDEVPKAHGAPVPGDRPDAALDFSAPSGGIPGPTLTFDGLSSDDNQTAFGFRIEPPDTNADVGPGHIVETVNLLFRVYDKTGSPLTPVAKISSLFAPLGAPCGSRDDGDPIVLYDPLADRWLISQFCIPVYLPTVADPSHQLIAISQTGDPTGSYFLYDFVMPNPKLNDYPHFGVWPDAYYMSDNQFGDGSGSGSFTGAGLFAFDRVKMLAGDPTATFIYIDYGPIDGTAGGMLPTDFDGLVGPPPGTPNLFMEFRADEFGDPADALRIYEFRPDFVNPGSSTLTVQPDLPVAAFDARMAGTRDAIEQPAPATSAEYLDAIADRMMHRIAYRTLPGGVQSYVANWTVNVSGVNPTGAATYQAGIRFEELRRNPGTGAVTIQNQLTWAPGSSDGANGRNIWMGSAAQDNQGNSAVGFSASSLSLMPSIFWAGRLASDAADTFGQGEASMFAGAGVQQDAESRWGDYSSMSVDPSDDCTFWYAQEYYANDGNFDWKTRIGDFKFPGCTAAPKGTLSGQVTICSGGLPLAGAFVTVDGGYVRTTDVSGNYSMTLPPGNYTVTITKPGFTAGGGNVVITDGGTTGLNACLSGTPVLSGAGATLVAENCPPFNGVLDPRETVTVSFCLQNDGGADTIDLVATLQATGGVTDPSAPQSYGVLTTGGAAVCREFVFTVDSLTACGDGVTATLTLADGASFGTVTYTFTTGTLNVTATQNFDGVTAPALPAGWTASNVAGPAPLWVTSTVGPDTAPNDAFVDDPNVVSDKRLDSPVIAIASDSAQISFRNFFNLESTYDGGVLEIMIGGGAFQDVVAAGGSFVSGGYNATIDLDYMNPLAGRPAWSGNSGGYVTSVVKLPAAAQGQNVVLRWRMGSDESVSGVGWRIDTISLADGYACCGPIAIGLQVDAHLATIPTATGLNKVFEPGESVMVEPSYLNASTSALPLNGTASNFTGPAGATYTLTDVTADYGSIASFTSNNCYDATGNCYVMALDDPAVRPAPHWDATFDELLSSGATESWTLHIGDSFLDVPDGNIFYSFIETIFHNGVTGGCGGGNYCPVGNVTRAQMAVFLLKGSLGSGYTPPACTGTVFGDVPCTGGIFDPWIEDLAARGITGGCGGGNYCPAGNVTRAQMAVFLLKASQGAGYTPPACTGTVFADVPCTGGIFDPWIEDLAARGITGGCGGGNYCPGNPNTRGQMAVFLTKTFGLVLYGP